MTVNPSNPATTIQIPGGLEYVGKIAEVSTNSYPSSITGFSEFFASGSHVVNYLLNPYEGFTSANRSIISNEVKLTASPGKVATGRGTVFHKSTGSLVYSGDFNLGFRFGVGFAPIFTPDGTYEGLYRGEWKFSMRHGKGEMVYPDGSKFQGNWSHDRKNGAGLEYLASGGRFFGYFRNDVRQGQGRFAWNISSLFELREYNNGKVVASISKNERELQQDEEQQEIVSFFNSFHLKVKTLNGYEVLVENSEVNEKPAPGGIELGEDFFNRAKNYVLPKLSKTLSDLVGYELPITLLESSFTESKTGSIAAWMIAAEDGAHTVVPLINGIKAVVADDLCKEVFVEKVKSVQLVNGKPFDINVQGSALVVSGEFEKGEVADIDPAKVEKVINSKL